MKAQARNLSTVFAMLLAPTAQAACLEFPNSPIAVGQVCAMASAGAIPCLTPPEGCDAVSCCNSDEMCAPLTNGFGFAAANADHASVLSADCTLQSQATATHATAYIVTQTPTSLAVAGQTLAIHTSHSEGSAECVCPPGVGHFGSASSTADLHLEVPFEVPQDTYAIVLLSSLTRNVAQGRSNFSWSISGGASGSHTVVGQGTSSDPQSCFFLSAGSHVLELDYDTSLGVSSGVGGPGCGGSDDESLIGGDAWAVLIACHPCDNCDCTCDNDRECDDGLFCTGPEHCVDGSCQSDGDPCFDLGLICDEANDRCIECLDDALCADGIDCTIDTCNDGTCENTPDDGACDDGTFCNGPETCDPQVGCVGGGGNPCPDPETCSEALCHCTDCPADQDLDRVVGTSDMLIVLGNWGPCVGIGCCPGDVNGDGTVGTIDLNLVLAAWGPCP